MGRHVEDIHRPMFRLVDAVTLVGVIGVLSGLLLPTVTSCGESARRAQCQNNLKNIVLAADQFRTTKGVYPPARIDRPVEPTTAGDANVSSIPCQLLRDLDEAAIYNALNFDVPMGPSCGVPAQNTTVASTRIGILVCPTDPYHFPDPYAGLNYRANVGLGDLGDARGVLTRPQGPPPGTRGAFDESRSVAASEFTDGLSNTVAFAEKLCGGGQEPFDASRDWVPAGAADPGLDADDWVRICSRLPQSAAAMGRTDSGRCWLFPGSLYSTFRGALTPNSPIPDCGSDALDGVGAFAPRSLHPGVVNVGWADGSVRAVRSNIDPRAWRMLLTRAGGETGDPDVY
ncbi:DUF1559 family PulG-like putative transporter [Paludisphaera mucosa]|uniref:DUF1559 domain-containing protein n=1 Tax=Paludisphaera mucosa TaxID=3030827 RepID=A0ABT6FE18_9BACT|nr:DUF1559 domain-containing protein [Paludisphaera mucosa]MDG3005805.1 DUF1559 domain-containing protein [Paludisphaera mucosa]